VAVMVILGKIFFVELFFKDSGEGDCFAKISLPKKLKIICKIKKFLVKKLVKNMRNYNKNLK
jgi:hypothetical protein